MVARQRDDNLRAVRDDSSSGWLSSGTCGAKFRQSDKQLVVDYSAEIHDNGLEQSMLKQVTLSSGQLMSPTVIRIWVPDVSIRWTYI